MKKILVALLLLLPSIVFAQYTVPQGGTGKNSFPLNEVLLGNSSLRLKSVATSSLGLPLFSDLAGYLSLTSWYATTTDGLDEGSTNLYYTEARVQSELLDGDNAILGTATTTNLSVSTAFNFLGTVITNVSTWFNGLFDTQLATKDTDDLAQGATNLYNQTHTGEVTGATSLTVADNIIDEANLKVNTASDGYLLSASSTASGGLAWLSVVTDFLTFGDGLTRTANDIDCDTASGSVFGCLSSADWTTFNNKQPAGNYITALTGDGTASGAGSVALTLATVNSNVGSFGSATQAPALTVNGKGLITAVSNTTVTPAVGSITGLGTGVGTALGVNVGTAGSVVVNGGALGTPSSGTLSSATGLPISTGVSGLGTGVATFLATPSSANLDTAVTDDTGSGALVFATSPTLVTPALGTPSSGTVTNLTGTASININGTVGATTPTTGAFTTLSTSATTTHNGPVYMSSADGTGFAFVTSNDGVVGTGQFSATCGISGDAFVSGFGGEDLSCTSLTTTPTFTTTVSPTIYGSTASGGDLAIKSTSHATDGTITIGDSETDGQVGIGGTPATGTGLYFYKDWSSNDASATAIQFYPILETTTSGRQVVSIGGQLRPAAAVAQATGFGTLIQFGAALRQNTSSWNVTTLTGNQIRLDELSGYSGAVTTLNIQNLAAGVKGGTGTYGTMNVLNIPSGHGTFGASNVRAIHSAIAASSTAPTSTYNLYVDGTAPNYFAGSVGIGTASPGSLLSVTGVDNTTASEINFPVTSANCTATDIFMKFTTTAGTIGSIACTSTSGLVAYNTFTGSHFTIIDDMTNVFPNALLLATGEPVPEHDYLSKAKLSCEEGSKQAYGVYGGTNDEGYSQVLSVGTGKMWLANEGDGVEVGDLLMSSDLCGFVEKQHGFFSKFHTEKTVAKAMTDVVWEEGERGREIGVVYFGG